MQVRVQPTQARPQRKHHITPHGWADRSARSWLRRHRIPRRNRPGTITERFPTAAPVTEAFLREAYVDIGLATTYIEQLTGQPMERILNLTRSR